MKKIISCILVVLLQISTIVYAQINVSVIDNANNKLNISGSAQTGEKVLLVVLNDGYTKHDVASGVKNAISYTRTALADEGGYSFDFTLESDSGGDAYTAYVSHGSTTEQKVFSFYSAKAKESFVRDLNNTAIDSAAMTKATAMFGLNEEALFKNVDMEELAFLLENLRDEIGGFSGDPDEFVNVLNQASVLNALNNNNQAVFSDGNFLYSELMGFDKLAEYEDYFFINTEGIELVKKALLSGTYQNCSQLLNRYKDEIDLQILINYNKLGYAHVPKYLNKYSSAYKTAGFKLDTLSAFSDKDAVYSAVASANSASLLQLAKVFNDKLVISPSKPNSVSTGAKDSVGYIQPEITQNPNIQTGDLPECSYSDVPTDFWAYEYINKLSVKGILNGRGNGLFSPFDMVTRSEFVKMIVLALELESEAVQCDFSDVQNHWSLPYVSVALQNGFVKGISDTEFAPALKINREQAATMLARAMGLKSPEVFNVFTDNDDISDYAKGYVYALRNEGVVSGKSDNAGFAPKDKLSRAEAAKMIYYICDFNVEQ